MRDYIPALWVTCAIVIAAFFLRLALNGIRREIQQLRREQQPAQRQITRQVVQQKYGPYEPIPFIMGLVSKLGSEERSLLVRLMGEHLVLESSDMAEAVNQLIKTLGVDARQVWDGHNTFEQLYEQRTALFVLVAKQYYADSWRSRNSNGISSPGWFTLGIYKEAGHQVSCQLPDKYWEITSFAQELEVSPQWDGHQTKEVLERIEKMTRYAGYPFS